VSPGGLNSACSGRALAARGLVWLVSAPEVVQVLRGWRAGRAMPRCDSLGRERDLAHRNSVHFAALFRAPTRRGGP
jgi:hypothetical protein